MKQYLKMADCFNAGMPDVKTRLFYAEHAINSHDGLVHMNQELLAALEEISNLPSYRQDECSEMAREAIAKAKGGAA